MEIIAFPDAEGIAVTYLKSALTGTTVSTKIPNPRPAKLVRVTRVGGRRRDLITDSANLTFECWDTTTVAAFALCRLVRAHINAIEGTEVNGEWVYRVTEIGGPAFFPDPDTDYPRYQFTVALDLRGGAI